MTISIKWINRSFLAVAVLAIICALAACTPSTKTTSSSSSNKVVPGIILSGVCFSPIRDDQNPDCRVLPTKEEIQKDLDVIRKLGGTHHIRTYSSLGSLGEVPIMAESLGIECWPGAWLSKYHGANEKEIQALITVGKKRAANVPALIVGNEVLLRGDLTEDQLIGAIQRVKRETNLPVAYAEIGGILLEHPKVVASADVLLVHLYPYWDKKPIDVALESLLEQWKRIAAAYPSKRIMIGETGWPSDGEINGAAVPSPLNQARYLKEFIQTSTEHGIDYFYFSLFSEKWKIMQEGVRGGHWGIFSADGVINPNMQEYFPSLIGKKVPRASGTLPPVQTLALPAFIYREGESDENRFYPTNWMGDRTGLRINEHYVNQPHSGDECLQINYTGQGIKGWAGIYWVGPYINHWGEYPGYSLHGARQVIFWARGDKGDEKVVFKIGGIDSYGKAFHDSFGPLPFNEITTQLTTNWKQYHIDLTQVDTSRILGGFCIAVNNDNNPHGCTIYLDDVVIVGDLIPPPLPKKRRPVTTWSEIHQIQNVTPSSTTPYGQ